MIIWGSKGYSDLLGYIRETCPECRTDGIFEVHQTRSKFTLYFIPTFTYRRQHFMVCRACGTTFKVPDSMKEEIAANLVTREDLVATLRYRNRQADTPSMPSVVTAERTTASPGPPALSGGTAKRYCLYCGTQLLPESRFCHACGRQLPNTSEPCPE